MKKFRHITAVVLVIVGMTVIFGITGEADFSHTPATDFLGQALVGLLAIGAGALMAADMEFSVEPDEDWDKEKSRR